MLTDSQYIMVVIVGVILLEPLKDTLARRIAGRFMERKISNARR
jgi:hypothetical protein